MTAYHMAKRYAKNPRYPELAQHVAPLRGTPHNRVLDAGPHRPCEACDHAEVAHTEPRRPRQSKHLMRRDCAAFCF